MDEDEYGKFRLERVKHQDLELFGLKLINYDYFHPLDNVGRGSDAQLQVCGNINYITSRENVK